MRASNQNSSKQAERSDVGSAKGGTRHGSDATVMANTGDRRCFTVGDAKRWHTEFFGADRGLHCIAKTLAETDSDKQILAAQTPDASLHIPGASDGSVGIESEGHQPIAQMPTQRGGQVDPHDQDSAGPL